MLLALIQLSDEIRQKQRYLEMQDGRKNLGWEASASLADTVGSIGNMVDSLIAKHVVNHPTTQPAVCSRILGAVKREVSRRTARALW